MPQQKVRQSGTHPPPAAAQAERPGRPELNSARKEAAAGPGRQRLALFLRFLYTIIPHPIGTFILTLEMRKLRPSVRRLFAPAAGSGLGAHKPLRDPTRRPLPGPAISTALFRDKSRLWGRCVSLTAPVPSLSLPETWSQVLHRRPRGAVLARPPPQARIAWEIPTLPHLTCAQTREPRPPCPPGRTAAKATGATCQSRPARPPDQQLGLGSRRRPHNHREF